MAAAIIATLAPSRAVLAQTPPTAGFPPSGDPAQPPAPPPPAPAAAPAPNSAPVAPAPQPVFGPYQRRPWTPPDEVKREDYVRVGPPGVRRHDGLFLRFAAGIGTGRNAPESDDSYQHIDTGDQTSFDESSSGFAYATEIALGFTPIRDVGFVLGAGVYTATVPSMEVQSAPIGEGRYEFGLSQLALLSPHLDFYVDPDSGLHFQGGFGFAVYIAGQAFPTGVGQEIRAHTATGVGFMLGVGYDWFVSDQWSFGVLGRVLYAWTEGQDPENVIWSHKTLAPTLMLTATYH